MRQFIKAARFLDPLHVTGNVAKLVVDGVERLGDIGSNLIELVE